MRKIKWLLDVDGVINATKAGWSAAPQSGWAYANANSWRMRWEPKVIKNIREIHELPHVEVLWATTWVGHTDQLERLFKLPALCSAGPVGMDYISKRRAAEEVLFDGYQLIWTDDEAIPLTWQTDESKLLLRPRSRKGLRPEHFTEIRRFIACT